MGNNPSLWTCGDCKHCGSRWHTSDNCEFRQAIAFVPLHISEFGEALAPYPGDSMSSKKTIGHCFATHFICRGFVDLHPVSSTHNAICCRACKLRVVIPNTLETWGDLREHFGQQDLTGKRVAFTDERDALQVGRVIGYDQRTTRPDHWAITDGSSGGSYSRPRSNLTVMTEVNHDTTQAIKDGAMFIPPTPGLLAKKPEPEVDESHGISGGEHDCVKEAIAQALGVEEAEE